MKLFDKTVGATSLFNKQKSGNYQFGKVGKSSNDIMASKIGNFINPVKPNGLEKRR